MHVHVYERVCIHVYMHLYVFVRECVCMCVKAGSFTELGALTNWLLWLANELYAPPSTTTTTTTTHLLPPITRKTFMYHLVQHLTVPTLVLMLV